MFGKKKEEIQPEPPKTKVICKFCNSGEVYLLSFSMNIFSIDGINVRNSNLQDMIVCNSCGRCMLK